MRRIVTNQARDNARNRRRARREAQREQVAQETAFMRRVATLLSGCSARVVAATIPVPLRVKESPEHHTQRNNQWYTGPRANELTCQGKQKRCRREKPLIR